MKYFPVLFETGGNQSYIFSTNRLRENAGASNNVFEAGTGLVISAVCSVFEGSRYQALAEENELTARDFVRQLDDLSGFSQGHEIVLATSGKALLLVASEDKALALVRRATFDALENFPGLVLTGVVGEPIGVDGADAANVSEMSDAIRNLHDKSNAVRARMMPVAARFPNFPFLQPCHSSGLPAHRFEEDPDGKPLAYSSVVLAKRGESGEGQGREKAVGSRPWFRRVKADLNSMEVDHELAVSGEELEKAKDIDWFAIVHADGNGFGQYFLGFGEYASENGGAKNARDVLNLYRRFSGTLEICGLKAFAEALGEAGLLTTRIGGKKTAIHPVVPIILGGDDLTVVMDGRRSLKFTEAYLRAFEKVTAEEDLKIYDATSEANGSAASARNAISFITGGSPLGAAAGVAIVKPHFPFHRGYELAEELIASAKQSKVKLGGPAVSAMDFHVLFDGGATNLEDIRKKMKVGDEILTHKPYIVSDEERVGESLKDKDGVEPDWARLRYMSALREVARELDQDENASKPVMPRTQLHMLRDAVFQGVDIATNRFDLIKGRYKTVNFSGEEADDGKLFAEQDGRNSTLLIDLIELKDLEDPLKPSAEQNDAAEGEAA